MVSRLSRAVASLMLGMALSALPLMAVAAQQEKPPAEPRNAPPAKDPPKEKAAPPKTSNAPQRDKARPASEPPKRTEPKPPPKSTGEPALRRRKP